MKRQTPASRKIANVFLSVVLVLGLAPVSAYAQPADNAGAAPAAAEDSSPAIEGSGAAVLDVPASPSNFVALELAAFASAAEPHAAFADVPPAAEPVSSVAELQDASVSAASEPAVPAVDTPTNATLTPGWTQEGTCEWKIDAEGNLTVRPLGNGTSGEMHGSWGGSSGLPWYDQRLSVKTAYFEPGVSIGSCFDLFNGCSNLVSADLSQLDTSNVTTMGYMFTDCHSLESVNLRGLDTSNVRYMDSMFYYCKSLTSLDLSSFDTSNVLSMRSLVYGCSNLVSINLSNFNTSSATDMASMFSDCTALASLDVSSFDTSGVTNMGGMFAYCPSLTSLDLSGFDTSSVTNMGGMFSNCRSLATLDISGFDTAKVERFHTMFSNCMALTSLDLTHFDTSCAEHMSSMFSDCAALTSLDVSSFNTSGVIRMESMFANCEALTSLDVSNFDTSSVMDMKYMFSGCSSLVTLDLSSFDTSNVTEAKQMFHSCNALTSLDLSHFDLSKVDSSTLGDLLYGCFKLSRLTLAAGLDLSNKSMLNKRPWIDTAGNVFDSTNAMLAANAARTSGAETYAIFQVSDGWTRSGSCEWMIDTAGMLTVRPLSCFTQGKLEHWIGLAPWYAQRESVKAVHIQPGVIAVTCESMFFQCGNMVSADLSGLDTSLATNMSKMFYSCELLASLDLSGFDTSCVTTMNSLFSGCKALISLDLSMLDASNVKSMNSMFNGCMRLADLNLKGWDTSSVTDMDGMFIACSELASLDLSSFDTSQVETMRSLFAACDSLTALDITSFDTANAKKMDYMFQDCSQLKAIYVSKALSTAKVVSSSGMFSGCQELVGGAGTAYNAAHTDATYARVDQGFAAPGYFSLKRGDVTGNGLVNVVDAQIAYEIATTTAHQGHPDYAIMRICADVTGPAGVPDGQVCAEDAFAIQHAALRGWGEALTC